MADKNLSTWMDLLGKRVNSTDWNCTYQADSMVYSLLRLPPRLQQPVLTTASSGAGSLWKLIDKCPTSLHSAILSATIKDNKLTVPAHHFSILDIVATTVFPFPGLLQLTVAGPPINGTGHFQTSAALLSRAVDAHPSLTTLFFNKFLHPQWLIKFSSCLQPSALTRLCDLRINIRAHPCGCDALVRCLRSCSHIHTLHVDIQLNSIKGEQLPTLGMLRRSAASPVYLRRLTVLRLAIYCTTRTPKNRSDSFRAFAADITLLQLLPFLNAPALTSLALATDGADVFMLPLRLALGNLTTMQHLCIDAAVLQGCTEDGDPAPQLPQTINTLEIRSGEAAAPLTTAAVLAATAPASLKRLRLTRSPRNSDHWPDRPDQASEHCGNIKLALHLFAKVVVRFTLLQSLSLDVLAVGMGSDGSIGVAAVLSKLPQLMALSLQSERDLAGWESAPVLFCSPIIPVLSQLQGLQRLRLCCTTDAPLFDSCMQFLHACSVLCSLSRLEVLCMDVDTAELARLVPGLPRLETLCLHPDLLTACPDAPVLYTSPLLGVSVEAGSLVSDYADDDGKGDGGK